MGTTFCILVHEEKSNLIISIEIEKGQKFYKKELMGSLKQKALIVAKLLNSFALGKNKPVFLLKNETSFHETIKRFNMGRVTIMELRNSWNSNFLTSLYSYYLKNKQDKFVFERIILVSITSHFFSALVKFVSYIYYF